jgi:flagellar hook-associated protein 1
MGLSQALSAALSGVTATQQALSVISGNVANANTPGYVVENVNLVAVATAGQQGVGVDTTGINRSLNTLLQNQLWTETSGGSYADTVAQMYQQLQQVYGSPSSSSSFSAIYSNFTTALQALSTNPGSYSAQTQVVGSAQVLAQSLNAMTDTIQELRTQAEQGISADVQTANNAIADIAKINQQLGAAPADSATAMLEDQRDQDVAQLSKLMNVTVVRSNNNQMSVYTGTGQQLVSGVNASTLSFDNVGTMTANALWSANPSQDQAGTITLTTTGGTKTDLIGEGAIQSGEIGAYLQMRDTVLPQAQNQLDELANQMSQALSNQTTSGTAVTSGSQSGYIVDVGSVLPGNTLQLTYTDSSNTQHTATVVAARPRG